MKHTVEDLDLGQITNKNYKEKGLTLLGVLIALYS